MSWVPESCRAEISQTLDGLNHNQGMEAVILSCTQQCQLASPSRQHVVVCNWVIGKAAQGALQQRGANAERNVLVMMIRFKSNS